MVHEFDCLGSKKTRIETKKVECFQERIRSLLELESQVKSHSSQDSSVQSKQTQIIDAQYASRLG